YTDQPQSRSRSFSTRRNDGPQKSRKSEQDCDGFRANHFQYFARADAARIVEVNACACQQRGHDIADADDRARRSKSQQSVRSVDMRGVDRLSHALQQVSLTIHDTLWPPGATGREQDASGFVHANGGRPPTLVRGSGQAPQTDDAQRWHPGLNPREAIL